METMLAPFACSLPQDIDLRAMKHYLACQQNWLSEQFNLGKSVVELVRARSLQMDSVLAHVWQNMGLEHPSLSLVAVGGYGRNELHPRSDIDILILCDDELPRALEEKISGFITYLWDLRLDVGHSVRSVQECITLGKEDITIATNLLESRLLIGDGGRYKQLASAVKDADFWPAKPFFHAKKDEQIKRHQQYNGNAYSLEPDLKANPGGLRDIQTICWVAGRHFGSSQINDLVEQGFLTRAESRELIDCRDFLWRVRFALHLHLNKADDRLLFDRQLAVAQQLGYRGEYNEPVERLMKHFYQTIRRVSELNEMLLQLFDEATLGNITLELTPIDEHFHLRGKLIACNAPDLFLKQPEQILMLFMHIAGSQHIEGIYSASLRQLREARRRLPQWLHEVERCRACFTQLIKHPNAIAKAIPLMHRYGVLSAYFPAWNRIVGQMQFDLFHAFTVDEHTIRLIRKMHSFSDGTASDIHPLCSLVYPRLERPDLLTLAALFHDIAKGRKGDHSELGALDAESFCLNHGYSKPSARMVAWLVKHHLLMSVTAQRRDIYDPEVIVEFATKVRDQRHLDMLLCLTVADICATNDNTWNSWKRTLLAELYNATKQALLRGLENPVDVRGMIRNKKAKAFELLAKKNYSVEQIKMLWQRFRADYFLRHTPEQIAWHSDHLWGHSDEQPLVLVSRHANRGGTEIFIHTPDVPHLFASVAALLEQRNLSIHDAQVMASRDGFALDTFVVLDRDHKPLSSSRVKEVRGALQKMLVFAMPVSIKPRRMPRQVQQFSVAPRVAFLPSKGKRTLIEVAALDKPGLLARISAVFAQLKLTIHAAKITTIGERAEDFFSLTDENREPLNANAEQALKAALLDALNK